MKFSLHSQAKRVTLFGKGTSLLFFALDGIFRFYELITFTTQIFEQQQQQQQEQESSSRIAHAIKMPFAFPTHTHTSSHQLPRTAYASERFLRRVRIVAHCDDLKTIHMLAAVRAFSSQNPPHTEQKKRTSNKRRVDFAVRFRVVQSV